ncbi:MAG: hypothetical protein M0037_13100 [Betaproteobacteria bacterium]|nr:hypothetical protein [Betaproteobacteria bacterium]
MGGVVHAHLLHDASYRQVAVTRHEIRFVFAGAAAACGVFDAVELDWLLAPLAPREAAALREEVQRILAGLETGEGVSFDFRRLYASAFA